MDEIIRDPAFGRRLTQSCDAHPHCPEPSFGRGSWLIRELMKRYAIKTSAETVRKWMKGVIRPRQPTCEKLAELLNVDPTWLYVGVDPDMTPRERKARNAEADGVVNLVAGFIQMDGGSPAFPKADDQKASDEHIDLYAIIRGINYQLHISLAYEHGKSWRFPLPSVDNMPIILGVVREGFTVRIFEISTEMIEEKAQNTGGARMLTLTDDEVDAAKLENFKQRLP